MKLNPKKWKVLHVTNIRLAPDWPILVVDHKVLEACDKVNILIIIQSYLRQDIQVDHMLFSAIRKLFALQRLKIPNWYPYTWDMCNQYWNMQFLFGISLYVDQVKRLERVQRVLLQAK